MPISVVGTAKPKITFKTNELEIGEGWRVIIDLDTVVNDPDTEKDQLNWKIEPIKVLSALINPVSQTLVIEAPKESAGSYKLNLSVTDPDNNKETVTLSVMVIDYQQSKPVITEPDDSKRILTALDLTTVSPMLTWPSPATTTSAPLRKQSIVVACQLALLLRLWSLCM